MRRREFITLLGGAAAAWPPSARAQLADRVRRIGVLMASLPEGEPDTTARVVKFQQELERLGWSEGRNVRIDYRYTPPAGVISISFWQESWWHCSPT
jgi:putative ABC transport system substrate-binding protein